MAQKNVIDLNKTKCNVFVSYQWDSKKEVREIVDYLQENNITTWFDEQTLSTKDVLKPQIAKGISESDFFLCFITKKYAQSENCVKETHYADMLKKHIIPVMLEDIELRDLKGGLAFLLYPTIRINYYKDRNKNFILKEIERLIEVCSEFEI